MFTVESLTQVAAYAEQHDVRVRVWTWGIELQARGVRDYRPCDGSRLVKWLQLSLAQDVVILLRAEIDQLRVQVRRVA